MARVLVSTDDSRQHFLDERSVTPVHLNDEHAAEQFIERLAWAIQDAEDHEQHRHASRRRRVADAVLAQPIGYLEVEG